MTPRRARLIFLTLGLAAAALSLVRASPPAPAPADAPADRFSALRARETIAALLGDSAAHPVGSPANAAVRARLIAHLRSLGLDPEEQRTFACSDGGTCAPVVNVIVWLPGQVPGPAVGLLAHYDSVPAGPGVADDLHGVATTLELLEILQQTPRRNPLAAIFTDGEEAGLLGARAFAEHPRFRELGVVLNAEARGTTGAARMFETSDGNAALIAALAHNTARPSALSLSYEVYRLLPNDTDLTIFKRHGAQGLNFAFIGGVQRYHTPLDDLAHLDLGSVQQQGDAMLATARALLATDLSDRPSENAHYADLFAAVLLRWPARVDLPLAVLTLLALLAAWLRAHRATPPAAARPEPARPSAVALAASATLLAPLLAALAAAALLWLVERLSGPLGAFPAAPHWPVLAASLAAAATSLALLSRVARRVGPLAQALGTWLVWTLLALVLALVLPGASILLLAPAALAGLLALRPRSLLGPGLAAVLALALWAPLAPSLTEALGLSAPLLGALVGWLSTALAPACAEEPGEKDMSRATWLLLLLALGSAALAAAAPRVDVDHPAKLNLLHVTDLDTGAAHYVADAPGGLAPEVAAAAAWEPPRALLPWSARAVPAARAPAHAREPATLTRVSTEPRDATTTRVTWTLRAPADTLALLLILPGDAVTALKIAGRPLDPARLRPGPSDTRLVTIFGPPPEGLELTADLRDLTAWKLVTLHAGLPPNSPAAARPPHFVPYQLGDLTATARTLAP